jgi:hypothetical protein
VRERERERERETDRQTDRKRASERERCMYCVWCVCVCSASYYPKKKACSNGLGEVKNT